MSETETDTLLEIPQLAESPAPDAGDIEAALQLGAEPSADGSAPAPDESQAPNAGQFGAGRPGNIAPGPRGALDPDRWSRNKMRNATKKQLHERIEQLQDRQPPPTSADGARASVTGDVHTPMIDPALLIGPLVETFRTTFELLAVALGKHWLADDAELRKLAVSWAPIAAHHAPRAGEYLPWLMAIATTAGVVAPRVRLTRAEAVESASAADAAPPPPPNRTDGLTITD